VTVAHAQTGNPAYGRRVFLGVVAGGVSALWWAPTAWNGISQALGPAARLLPDDLRAALPSPSSGWRIYTVNPPMPRFDPASWSLRIEGLVEQPVELSIEDLRALPAVEQTSDFHCVTGWSVPDVRWRGVRFGDLLALARPQPQAGALTFLSSERPYADTLTLDQAAQPDALLAYDMDDSPLERKHGAPARVVMPQMYGYKSVKWVERIVVTRRAEVGYWEQRGYDRDAWIDGEPS
jgi:DMSO/TMAO reductase YedYZ molybdopterin-dependent catalytic subunit